MQTTWFVIINKLSKYNSRMHVTEREFLKWYRKQGRWFKGRNRNNINDYDTRSSTVDIIEDVSKYRRYFS